MDIGGNADPLTYEWTDQGYVLPLNMSKLQKKLDIKRVKSHRKCIKAENLVSFKNLDY